MVDQRQAQFKNPLDTSSEDSDGRDELMPITSFFADKLKQDNTAPAQMTNRTQALPKGPTQANDLLEDILNDLGPTQSHQLPKGKMKLINQVKEEQKKAQKEKKNRPVTLELLQGFAETAQQRERRERKEAEERLAKEKERILKKREELKASKIGRGLQPTDAQAARKGGGASTSPLRPAPADGAKAAEKHVPMFGKPTKFAFPANGAQDSATKMKSRIPGISPKSSNVNKTASGASPQRMYPSAHSPKSGIGRGARTAMSPTNRSGNQSGLKVEKMTSGHFGPSLSPVKDEDVDKAQTEASLITMLPNFEASESCADSSLQASQNADLSKKVVTAVDAFISQVSAGSDAEDDHKSDEDRLQMLLQPHASDDGKLESSPHRNSEGASSKLRESSPTTLTEIRQVELEEFVIVDLLILVKQIRRRPKANLIDEIQKEIDAIEASIAVTNDLPQNLAMFDVNFDFKKYRPGVLSAWDLEMKKLEPKELLNVPQFDLDAFSGPFGANIDHGASDRMSMTPRETQRLRFELSKVQNDLDKMLEGTDAEQFIDDNDSDDLVNGKARISEKILESEQLLFGNASELDSASHELPVPGHLKNWSDASKTSLPVWNQDGQEEVHSYSGKAPPGISVSSVELMTEQETAKLLKDQHLHKIAQLHQGELDTLTEHPDQEDLMSQIDALDQSQRHRGAMMPSKRLLNHESDMISQIDEFDRKEKRKGARIGRVGFSEYFTQEQVRGMQSSLLAPSRPAEKSLESLATRESKRIRSLSLRARVADMEMLDSESDAYSALQSQSDESIIQIGSREHSKGRGDAAAQTNERDVDALDASLINLTAVNRDFQKLVEEAKKEKARKNKLSLQIDTNMTEVEDGRERLFVGELPKPLPKPKNKEEQEVQRKELRELVTYKETDKQKKEEAFIDTVPRNTQLMSSNSAKFEAQINASSLLSLLITDSSLKKARTAHLYVCEDRELSKAKVGLKILYEQLVKQNEVVAAAFVLLKIAKVFFCLNQLNVAAETISKSVSDLSLNNATPPAEALFWKGLIYFYLIFTKRMQAGSRKLTEDRKQTAHRELSQMINSCENALVTASKNAEFKILGKFVLLKLALFVQRERFGCDLLYVTGSDPLKLAQSIQHDEYYYGQIAMSEVYIDGQERKPQLAHQVLEAVIRQFPQRGEAYIKLWQLHMFLGNELKRSQSQQQLEDQRNKDLASSVIDVNSSQRLSGRVGSTTNASSRTQSIASADLQLWRSDSITELSGSRRGSTELVANKAEKAKKYYAQAYEIVSQLLQNCDENFTSTPQQRLLLVFLSVKSLQKSGQYIQAFELLQREFAENPAVTSLLYLYGKYVVKAMASEVHEQLTQFALSLQNGSKFVAQAKKKKGREFRIDQGYLGSGIGALEDCLRSCFTERHAKVNYYIGFAYKVLRMPLKTQEYWVKANKLHTSQRILSHEQANQVNWFLKEQQFFTIIGENADNMIKEKQGLTKPEKVAAVSEQAKQDMVKEYMKSMQNMERIDRPNSLLFQARMEAYLIEQPAATVIFGKAFEKLLELYPTFIDGYIHYWHYLKFRLTQMSKRGPQGVKAKHADQVLDNSGKKLLDKMRECAQNALMQSDATEVPTSLWVEARIIYAKQMIFEKEIGRAIRVLKDICYIIPPYPIEGLSYVQTVEEESREDILSPETLPSNNMTAEEMFMRQADLMKARNSPTRARINKDAPLFQKKKYSQLMFEGSNAPRSHQVLPKGKLNLKTFSVATADKNEKGQPSLKAQTKADGNPEENDIFAQILNAEEDFSDSKLMKSAPQLGTIIEEDSKSDADNSGSIVEVRKNRFLGDAYEMLDRITALQKEKANRPSVKVNIGGIANQNRISMYRKQPQVRSSQGFSAKNLNDRGDARNRSLTIYNPFNFNKEMMDRQVSQSLNTMPHKLSEQEAKDVNASTDPIELAYQAMLKAQIAWQEQNRALDGINEVSSSLNESIVSESRQEAIIQSENFAIYNNFKFLQLIGKYCAKSKQYSDEGLKALNDYMLLLEYHRSSYTKVDYYKERAITIFFIGSIFYNLKDYFHAVEHLLPIQEQLHICKFYKELAASERKISKIWRLNFNEQTVNWNYFSIENMNNFKYLEDQRQAKKVLHKMARAGAAEKAPDKKRKIHQLY